MPCPKPLTAEQEVESADWKVTRLAATEAFTKVYPGACSDPCSLSFGRVEAEVRGVPCVVTMTQADGLKGKWVIFAEAQVSYADREIAKSAGFGWDAGKRAWTLTTPLCY